MPVEDEYVSKQLIQGLPEFHEVPLRRERESASSADREQTTTAVKRSLLRLCVLRIFRPDLVEEQL